MTTLLFSLSRLLSQFRRQLGIAMAICLGLWIAPQLPAQTLSSITGTITDSSGALTPNAKVTITNVATGVIKTATASSAGTYVVTDLIPGTYTVRVELAGFQAVVLNGVGVEVGKASTVDAVLKAGNVTQTMEVSADVIALDTTQPNLNTTIENRVVQELPNEISGGRGRQIDQFVFLAPGVTGGTFSKRINGGVDFENEVVFNGVPMAQSETQGFQTIWNPPFEQVNQFNVLRSSFSAQYGLAQGVVTYQTASGTNQLHGDAFEILRNDFFDARGAYNPTTPVDKEHNFGFSLAGPVILPKLYNGKNRTFFFVTFEWYRLNQSDTSFMSMPTAAEKAGDFSATGLTIIDPATGTPFAGSLIPSSRFSPLSTSLLQYLPDPTLPGFSNNLQSLRGVLPQRQNPWGFNIDHAINDKQSIHWAEWRDKQTSYGTETASRLPTSNPLTSNTYNPNLGTVFILSYSNTISPHVVMTAGASWLGELNDQLSQRTTALNFAAAPGAPQVSTLNFAGPLSPTSLGSTWIASVNRKLGWVAENNWLWMTGRHTFNIGMEVRRTYQDDNECQSCAGSFNFSNNQTADPNNLGNTGNSFASFLLGTVDSANRIGSTEQRLRNWDFSPYIQDDIKLTRNLTVNLGVRWDVMVPFTAIGNNIVYFDSTIANPGAGGLLGAATKFGNCAGCANLDRAAIHYNHFSPRVGFSYALNSKTVLQGGFSQNYLNGGAYEYGTHKVAVNYGNLLLGSFTRNSTGSTTPGFGSWDSNVLPYPAPIPFTPTLGVGTQINAFDPQTDGRAPYDLVWSVGVQRELPFNMFVTASYAGNRGNFLPAQLNPINQLNPKFLAQYGSLLGQAFNSPAAIHAGIVSPYPNFANDFGSSATVLQALVPYPQYANIFNNFDDTGSSLYNAMQVQLEKRYTSGLSFLVSYSLSRMMSNTSSGFTSFSTTSLNKDNQKAEWSIDNNDQTHVATIAATYELPFGKGRRFMNKGGIANAAFGGWQFSPLLSYASGMPLQVNVPGAPLGTGGNRPNLVGGQPLMFSYSNVYSGNPVINAAAFSDPGPWAIGNEPRYLSGLRSPAFLNENFALAKYFPVGEKVKFKLEIEYFNALNRVIFGSPNTSLLDPNFGKVINSQANTQRQGQAHFTVTF
jgi:hypothetical protein